jgi:hypothetical protein
MISVSGLTSMVVNAAFAPQIAVPASVIYSERPPLAQVNPKEVARDLLTTKQYKCFSRLISLERCKKSNEFSSRHRPTA